METQKEFVRVYCNGYTQDSYVGTIDRTLSNGILLCLLHPMKDGRGKVSGYRRLQNDRIRLMVPADID